MTRGVPAPHSDPENQVNGSTTLFARMRERA